MIGNDVIDLKLASVQSNWRREGFLEKVFSPFERKIIYRADCQERMIWLLWSMKEAVYKAHQARFELPRRLNWKLQNCWDLEVDPDGARGVMEVEGKFYKTKSFLNGEYISTISKCGPDLLLKMEVSQLSREGIREKMIQFLASYYGLSSKKFEVCKTEYGIPYLVYRKRRFPVWISLSGHGRFSAFSVLFSPEILNLEHI